ncbi:universal stress protein [Paenibacillus sp. MSJ-34]|uniref:universal stress protein n=1 Tax=Paenibacillus sp. MSJ-34 TaxID=2841529 RepID=UPI001C124481|nr:universal stress protein [Paenibacillus sp. MSJ-34]MBU5445326.1 universal stress protein [Paenibacillus sp. MSJ-34]
MLFSRILVAYDGSNQSKKALDKAIQLTKANPFASLEVLHVFDFPRYYFADALVTAPVRPDNHLFELADKTVEEAKEAVASLANKHHVEMKQGPPAKTILEYAAEMNSDLIVLGSRGLGAIREFVLGSVSHNVVQHAKVPVLVIK